MNMWRGCGILGGGGGSRLNRISVIVLVVLLVSQRSVAEEEAAATGEEESGKEVETIHHEEPEAAVSKEVMSGTGEHNEGHDDDHHPVVHVGRGHGESCGEEVCDSERGLSCVEGKCECDTVGGQVYSEGEGKCEHTHPPEIPEVPDNSLEEGAVVGRKMESESEGEDGGAGKEEEEEVVPTTAAPVVPVKENSMEETKEGEEVEHHSEAGHDEVEHKEGEEEVHEGSAILAAAGVCANVNCEESLGRYSKCDEETGECHCSDVEGLNRALIQKEDHCIINRGINDPCSNHDECTATIAGKAWCHMDLVTRDRFCQCEQFHYFDDIHKECLPYASDGLFSPCKTDLQCTGTEVAITGHGLGPNGRCNEGKHHCECKLGPNGQKEFLYENYCFYQMMPGDACHFERECEVSFPGQNVSCVDGHCMCKDGEDITAISCPLDPADASNILGSGFRLEDELWGREEEKEDKGVLDNLQSAMGLSLPNFVFILIIGAVVLLIIVILSVFVVRKRHKYSVVQSRETKEGPDSPL